MGVRGRKSYQPSDRRPHLADDYSNDDESRCHSFAKCRSPAAGALRHACRQLARQTILIRELFADFQKNNAVTDADVQAEYDKFVAANGGKEYRARHILVETKEQAEAILASLKKGGKFEDIAKKQSKDTGSGANGGDLDWSAPGNYVKEFSQAMVALSKGKYSGFCTAFRMSDGLVVASCG